MPHTPIYEFMLAAAEGDAIQIKALLAKGVDPDSTLNGHGALHHATISNHIECAKLLIESGADVNLHAPNLQTFSMVAANYGYAEILSMLIAAGSDTERLDKQGFNAARYATLRGSSPCLEILLDAGARVDWICKLGKTHAMYAAEDGHHECLQILFDHACDLSIHSHNGLTAHMYAIENQNSLCADMILAEMEKRIIQDGMAPTLAARARCASRI